MGTFPPGPLVCEHDPGRDTCILYPDDSPLPLKPFPCDHDTDW